MESLWKPPTLLCNLSAPVYLTPLKPPKNHVFRTYSTAAYKSIPPPANWGIDFVGPNRAYIVERNGKYLKTLTTGIHLLNPIVDKIAGVHSLKEEEIEIPLETVTNNDLGVVVKVHLYIKVVDPYLATYGNRDGDTISAVTQLVVTTLPLRSMIEKILFNPIYDEAKKAFEFKYNFNESQGIVDPEMVKDYFEFLLECIEYFEIGDDINKITTAWGVKCLRFQFDFHQGKGKKWLTWQDLMVFLDCRISKVDMLKVKRLVKLCKQKADLMATIIEMLRDHYKRK
ncbi:hypothetical protein SLE2022_220340 [Rubroshorea leprosula]